MANLYHNDIYKFEKPINSYWESTISTHGKYETFEKDFSTNVVIIGGGYTGMSCALSLAKKYNQIKVETGIIIPANIPSIGINISLPIFFPSIM